MLRLFLAVEIPSNWQRELSLISAKVGKQISGAKWVPANNMHITLKFLGSCEESIPDRIGAVLSDPLSNFVSFHFKLGELGGFPSLKKARVFWVGVSEASDIMMNLASVVDQALVPLGFAMEDRKFHSHITLARFRNPRDLEGIVADLNLESIKESLIRVDCTSLFKSTLTPMGAIYECLAKIPLSLG